MKCAFPILLLLAAPGHAEIAVSANDGKQVLDDGRQVVPSPLIPDSISILDFGGGKVRTVATVAAPASVIGPPRSVAITPDQAYAIITNARRVRSDGRDIEPDDVVSVIDLKSAKVVSTIHAGAGASGVAIDPTGKRVLIADRAAGTVSLFSFSGGTLTPVTIVSLGDTKVSPAQPIFYANGTRALVTRDGDHRVSILALDANGIHTLGRSLAGGLRPYAIDTAGDRRFAVVGNIGGGGQDTDTISLIDLSGEEPNVVDTVAVGLTPEGVKMSPDGRFVALTVNNGSNAARESRHYAKDGLLQIWRIANGKLAKVTEITMGGWGQGMVWSADGRQILAQAMIGQRIESYTFDGTKLTRGPVLAMPAGPAAIAGADQ